MYFCAVRLEKIGLVFSISSGSFDIASRVGYVGGYYPRNVCRSRRSQCSAGYKSPTRAREQREGDYETESWRPGGRGRACD